MGKGASGGALRKAIPKAEMGGDELAAAWPKTALMTVVATALEERREAIRHHAVAYVEATGTFGSAHVVEAAVRRAVREGVEFFLDKLFSGDESGGK